MKEDDTPKCCEPGNEYIEWYIDTGSAMGSKLFTGWGILIDVIYYGLDRECMPINYCPFCGKKLYTDK